MRNLRNIQRSTLRFVEHDLLTATAWDTASDSLICAFGPSQSDATIRLKRIKFSQTSNHSAQDIAEWDAPPPNPDLECDSILSLHHFGDIASSCLVLTGGDIVLVREEPLPGEEAIEIVGSVDDGIAAARWSPDEELLAVCTKTNTFLMMSRDFDVVLDIKFSPEDIKAFSYVSVGWGKVETQFKGKRAKALRDPTVPEKVDQGLLSNNDDKKISITWRGDGEYVAVNSIEPGSRRMIRVYSREGVLDSVSEPVDYLESALSWRPAGNIITGVQRLEDRAYIIFFERNGLRHGQFSLRLTKEELSTWGSSIHLDWNVDSTVLAIAFKDRIQLWTMGNYHYYLKQTIHFTGPSSNPAIVAWNSEKSLRIVCYQDHELKALEYSFHVCRGTTSPPDDFGIVAVIDGGMLKLTPLRHANVPPPYAHHELQLDHDVIDAAIDSKRALIAVLSHCGVDIYQYQTRTRKIQEPGFLAFYSLPNQKVTPYQIAWSKEGFFVLGYDPKDGELIYRGTLQSNDTNQKIRQLEIQKTNSLGPTRISSIYSSLRGLELCLQTLTGQVKQTTFDSQSSSTASLDLPKFCPWIEFVENNDSPVVFGLSPSGFLYANNRQLTSNCTSFLVTPAHLIYTTGQHLLKFVHLTSVEDLEIPSDEPEIDERCRSIERGARLVTVTPSAYAVVLQMPRGNLETIYPRALVLAGIRRSIEVKTYRTAFLTCRNQRVDMNILHDHDPAQFMSNIDKFVDQVQKVEYIDLFLSQLKEEDVSQTMYKETLKKTLVEDQVNGMSTTADTSHSKPLLPLSDALVESSKINRVCDGFLRVLRRRTSSNLQNIITANVCKSPPDLEGGLKIVAELQAQGEDAAEKAAEHICFLADVNQLYDHALGMYELELALLIAQQSQKDPREYLPYVQGLQELQSLQRRFRIDDDLGRHKKALSHLYAIGNFEEVKNYSEKHELYNSAMELCKYEPTRLKELMKLYGDFLSSRNRFKDAGIAYEFLHDYASAGSAYRLAIMWREALSCASLLPLPDSELYTLARELGEGLVESKDFQGAATIYLDHLKDVEGATRLLCKGYMFTDAMRIIALHRTPELLESVIDPGLVDCFNTTTELLADCKEQIGAQVPRLRDLRIKKEQEPLAFYAGDPSAATDGDNIRDDISLAATDASTTGGTFMTRYTGRSTGTLNTQTTRRTSKNRRREERKRARGKKGSVYEEEYLVNSIGRLIERVNSTVEDVKLLVECLVRRGMREQASAIDGAMAMVLGLCSAILPEVYQTEQPDVEEDTEKPKGADGVLWDAMENVSVKKIAPVVKSFERLCLLE